MAGRAEIRELILGAAEGATGGVTALREAELTARLEVFDVEVILGSGAESGSGLSANIRFSIVVEPADSSMTRVA